MRKIMALMLAAIMLLILAGCGKTTKKDETSLPGQNVSEPAQTEVTDETLTGAMLGVWTHPDSPEITDELSSLFNKAIEGLVGAGYMPVAYIGRQVVSGTNHAFVCREKIVSPGTPETYSIVYIYEDTEGGAQIKEIVNPGVETWISSSDAPMPGGWSQAESPMIPDELDRLLDEAFEGMLGTDYSPVALLSNQIVAGTNYCILCEQTIVYPNADPEYVFLYLYEDLDGNAQITDIARYENDAADLQ